MTNVATPRHRSDRRRPRRRIAALAAVSGLALGSLSFAGAQGAISTLTNGQTISGIVAVNDARGGEENCTFSDPSKSRLSVTRVTDGAVVHTASRSGSGALSSSWNTVGQPLGQYRVRSWATDGKKSGFGNLGCTTQSEVLLSDLTVRLENKAAVAVSVPSHVVTGESLPVTVSTSVHASGISNMALGGRSVTVTVPGVGEDTVVTDAGRPRHHVARPS